MVPWPGDSEGTLISLFTWSKQKWLFWRDGFIQPIWKVFKNPDWLEKSRPSKKPLLVWSCKQAKYQCLNQSDTCYYQFNHSKGRGNPIKCLAQGHNKQTCQLISTICFEVVVRLAGKLWIPTFKVVWSDSAS